jgi:branched-chain amino acid transport system permease protein
MAVASKTNIRLPIAETLLGRAFTPKQILLVGIGVFILIGVGLFGDPYHLHLGAMVAIYAIAVIALDFLAGHGGQFSFGHNAFLGIGCYCTACLTTQQEWAPFEAMLAGMVLSLAVAIVVGYPTLRLKGIYLVTATMALGLTASALAVSLSDVTGGYAGIAGIPAFRIGGMVFKGGGPMYWLCWALVAGCLWLVTRLVNSRFGLALRTIALDHDVAQSLGVNPHFYKMMAFCLSAVMTSLSGSLLVHLLTIASPEGISFVVQTNMFTMLFIGGLGNDLGIVLGSAVVIILPHVMNFAKDYFPLIFGVMMLVILILRPRGLLASGSTGIDWRAFWVPRMLRRPGE